MSTSVVEMRHITKKFGNFKANDDISLTLHKGEILALLGENGAGKSTLMGMLSGLLKPTEGQILVEGKEVEMESPRDAKKLGIGMVHQHFMHLPCWKTLFWAKNRSRAAESTTKKLHRKLNDWLKNISLTSI